MSNKSSILRGTNCADSQAWGKYGYGGSRRTLQIQEIVEHHDYQITDIENFHNTTRISRYSQGFKLITQHKFSIKPHLKMVGKCGHSYQTYQANFARYPQSKVFLSENSNNLISYYAAREANLKIVVLPQNIESLVVNCKDYFTGQGLPHSLESEIEHLKKADAIFCISREEQWLLKLRGVKADFLPYYPPTNVVRSLIEVRNYRANNQHQNENRFLILGSAHNKPTILGMIEQLKWLYSIDRQDDFAIDIAGYDTEQIQSQFPYRSNFKFHGTVTSEKLQDLMLNTKAILLHQDTGVGALTRIPEMLIAGIPVIASSHACRSAWEYDGVYCYENELELAELMTKDFTVPEIPPSPVNAEKRFINYLNKIINE